MTETLLDMEGIKVDKKLHWCHVAEIVEVGCLHVRLSERPFFGQPVRD